MSAFARVALLVMFLPGCDGPSRPVDPLDSQLRPALAEAGVTQLPPLARQEPALVRLGQALMFDKILSGNRDISCATCHHSQSRSTDGLSLSIGTGGEGAGAARTLGAGRQFVPRNSQELFNRGYPEFTSMFWDGRVARGLDGTFSTPAGNQLPQGLNSVLAAQAMFPVTTRREMRGEVGDLDREGKPNELAVFDDSDRPGAWRAVMARVLAIDTYLSLFAAAYPRIPPEQLGFQHAANAIAAFEIETFTARGSPFDRYLAGDDGALGETEKRGALLFYGEVGCSACHLGPHLTDQRFHNIAVPQVGPGMGAERPEDHGRGRVNGVASDRFQFRTPPLRNVGLTGPWMHDGAYTTLRGAVRHYVDVTAALRTYDDSQLNPALQGTYLDSPAFLDAILSTLDFRVASRLDLSDSEIDQIVAFLHSLTDPASVNQSAGVPAAVPSGLPVAD